jgi:hypothetical protein
MTMTELALAVDVAEHWVQRLDPYLATQALVGFGLWSEADGIAPPENLEAAYRLAERRLGLHRQAISFRAEGTALVCRFVYADRPITASAQPQALALTRAILRAAYEARLL